MSNSSNLSWKSFGQQPTLVTVSSVLVTTGSSKDTAVSVSTFLGGAAPGSIAAGLKFNDAYGEYEGEKDVGSFNKNTEYSVEFDYP